MHAGTKGCGALAGTLGSGTGLAEIVEMERGGWVKAHVGRRVTEGTVRAVASKPRFEYQRCSWGSHEQRTHCPLLAGGRMLSQALALLRPDAATVPGVFHHRVGLLGRTKGGKLESHTHRNLFTSITCSAPGNTARKPSWSLKPVSATNGPRNLGQALPPSWASVSTSEN